MPLRYATEAMELSEAAPVAGPRTSVLLVTHNCERALRRSLAAIASSQPADSFEILVVDCGSQDGSGRIDEEFPAVTVLRLPRHFGRTKARNIGTRTAKGDFLFLLDPEVEVARDTLALLAERLSADESSVAVAPLLLDPAGKPIARGGAIPELAGLAGAWVEQRSWESALPEFTPSGEAIAVECPHPAAVLLRTQALRGMNYFDERYGEFGSDLDFAAQARKASRRILVLPSVTVTFHGSLTGTPLPGIHLADFGNGLAAYAAKHFGWAAGLRLKAGMALRALARFDLGLLSLLLSGQKIDGSQAYP